MSGISNWILSIAGIVCLSVIVELILPDGQMNKYIKGIMSFIITLVIITPLPSLLKSKKDYSNIFDYEGAIEVDEDYLYQLNLDKANAVKQDIENEINALGYKNVFVFISCDIFESKMTFVSVNVDISDLVITDNAEHNDIANIRKDITKIIQTKINLDEEAIFYVQWSKRENFEFNFKN